MRLPLGTLARSVTAQTTPRFASGDCAVASGVSLLYPVGDGVTESERSDCVLYLESVALENLNCKYS